MEKYLPIVSYGERNPGMSLGLIKRGSGYILSPISDYELKNSKEVRNEFSHYKRTISINRKQIEREFDRMLSVEIFTQDITDMIKKLRNEVFDIECVW